MTDNTKDSPETMKDKAAGHVCKNAKAAESGDKGTLSRRTFISWMSVGWGVFAASIAGLGGITLRFFVPNVLYEPQQTFRVGETSEYAPGEVSIRWKSKYGIWIVRLDDRIVALSTTCTHLGCTPNWLASEEKFKCPCHGSAFRANGINFEGPAPRPLERYKISLDDEGVMIVDKSVSFREERGQWDEPDAFVAV